MKFSDAETYTFGDTEALCNELLALVRSGAKRATCGAIADFEDGKEAMPVVGRTDISLHWDGTPALATRTVELRATTWETMTAEMALAEGEDETLQGWRTGHKRYFMRQGIFAPDMKLIWERFEVIEDFGEAP
ncbi:ASCH domain-containing protein [Roseobacter weihaiensis]|uniref:ASCH domain-containing protein n=1 Tax=Roseobacter weihaiensis TaxID=2763262 RepID=UPI001D0BB680|nr:ASCH domain-containing protein [Roseobacter sp. H9]